VQIIGDDLFTTNPQRVRRGGDPQGGDFLQSGLLSLGFFATAILAYNLARYASASERLAMERGIDLANLARVNQLVIRDLADGIVVVEDVSRDPRFASNRLLLEKGVRFYAGAPLRTASGLVLGSLCVVDSKLRKFSKKEQKLLQVIADELMAKIELECRRNKTVDSDELNNSSASTESPGEAVPAIMF
jgi:GAF domain-containing protein